MGKLLRTSFNLIIPVLLFISVQFSSSDILKPQNPLQQFPATFFQQTTGEILLVEDNRLIVKTMEGIEDVVILGGVSVTRNSNLVNLSHIQTNDLAFLIKDNQGQVLLVNTFSQQMVYQGKVAFLALFGLALIILMADRLIKTVRR